MSDKTYDPRRHRPCSSSTRTQRLHERGRQALRPDQGCRRFGRHVRQPAKADPGGLDPPGSRSSVLPHRSYQEGDYENWRQRTGPQVMVMENKVFEARHLGAGNSTRNSAPRRVTSLFTSTGRRAASPTRTSTFNSSSTASVRSSWSAWSPTPASSPPDASGWNSAITSRWSRMPPPPFSREAIASRSRGQLADLRAFHPDDGPVARRDRLTLSIRR